MTPDVILETYEAVATEFHARRDKTLFERGWLDRMLAVTPPPRRVLDLGCGPGLPIARYLVDRRAAVTGVDGAAAMVTLFRANVPSAEAICEDMRVLALGRKFDAIMAWNSFFHLDQDDQRSMFPIFRAHAEVGGALMFTTGPSAGSVIGHAAGEPVFHESLDPVEYRTLLEGHGFRVVRFSPEDPTCNGHTVWLARFEP